MKYTEYQFDEVVTLFDKQRVPLSSMERSKRQGQYRYYGAQGIIDYIDDYIFDGEYLLLAEDGENLKSNKQDLAQLVEGKFWVNNHAHILRTKDVCRLRYFFYWINNKNMSEYITGSAQPKLSQGSLKKMIIPLPTLEVQDKILSIIKPIDEKIKNNEKVNDNLEQQLAALFTNDFADDIAVASTDTCPMLGDLITVIDNRGKTPPLTTETFDYPIIDVGALKGSGRIVDFNNCTKYVEQSTYEHWFRSGHPQSWDILISTVGSLAEMKIYLGSKGCMAQNVVALRAVSISPLYLYQYLRFIRADLVAYNIGSVQPSIKVTHIVKHPIFVPESSKLENFEETAKAITNQLYANYNENESLKELRDILLPRLMSGEIDVSNLGL